MGIKEIIEARRRAEKDQAAIASDNFWNKASANRYRDVEFYDFYEATYWDPSRSSNYTGLPRVHCHDRVIGKLIALWIQVEDIQHLDGLRRLIDWLDPKQDRSANHTEAMRFILPEYGYAAQRLSQNAIKWIYYYLGPPTT